MSEFDLTTEKGMVAWLETLPEGQRRSAAHVLVTRAATRTMPFIAGPGEHPFSGVNGLDQLFRLLVLAILRSSSDGRLTGILHNASVGLAEFLGARAPKQGEVFHTTARTEAFIVAMSQIAFGDAFFEEMTARILSAYDRAYFEADNDAAQVMLRRDKDVVFQLGPEVLLGAPIWDPDQGSEVFADGFEVALSYMADDAGDWSFWIEWFDNILSGGDGFPFTCREITQE